jgi:hypothetical protein
MFKSSKPPARFVSRWGTRPRAVAIWMLVLTASALVACDGQMSPPVAPTSSPVPAVPPVPTPRPDVSVWDLTSVETAVTGPDNCFTQAQVRAGIPRSGSRVVGVIRGGDAISFDSGDDFGLLETGSLEGNAFTARSAVSQVAFPACSGGAALSGTFEGSVTGTFSEDHKHLTAKETWTYSFATGEITMFFDWTAIQR